MSDSSRDPVSILTALGRRAPRLELATLDLCFLAALHLRGAGDLGAAFAETDLFAAFDDVCAIVEPESENRRRRATASIQRLREQRMLTRVDGRGLAKQGEYALTRLAGAIVAFYLEEEALTRESLSLLTRTLIGGLALARDAAASATTPAAWASGVVAPLKVTLAELVAGIERRQRGLDLQQEEIQRRIAELLHADWFGALASCQSLLESTTETLRELNEVLLRDASELSSLLQEIQELAGDAVEPDAEATARRMADQVDRIVGWGGARQRAWSEFYEYVHHFLRDVVRLDPTRALTERLREQLRGKKMPRFSLTVAQAQPMRTLRTVIALLDSPPVRRVREVRERPPETVERRDPEAELDAEVRALLAQGVTSLSAITEAVTARLEPAVRFAVAGRVAQAVARVTSPEATRERPWTPVGDDIEIEEWRVGGGEVPS